MKKISILLLVLAAFLYAEVKVETAVRIENLPEEIFNMDNINDYMDDCASYGYCGIKILCPTVLDSNILFGWPVSDNVVEYYVLTGASHSWREIFEDEFDHYKKCGGIIASDSVYNSLFAVIDSVLVPEVEKSLKGDYNKPLIFDYSRGEMRGIAVPGPNFEFGKFADDSVDARNAAISSIRQNQYRLAPVRVQDHCLIVPAKLIDRPFVLFDVNGHELRRGTLKNNMEVPAYPTVIKIQGYSAKLLK